MSTARQCHFFCHLLESSLARLNWIRAVDKFCVEQLISCQKCRANDCRAIEFRAVDPRSAYGFDKLYGFRQSDIRQSDHSPQNQRLERIN